MNTLAIRLHENDNVITAKTNIDPKVLLNNEDLTTTQFIPVGHKIATKVIEKGEDIIKYDNIIGTAKTKISIGEHVHIHNTAMSDKRKDYEFSLGCKQTEIIPENQQATFMGYNRSNGKVGTRNYIGIISSVNCSATVCKKIAEENSQVEFVLIENMSHDEVIKIKKTCDILIDQIGDSGGWGYGMNSVESMALGLCCMTQMNGECDNFFKGHPFVNINENNLEQKLNNLILNPLIIDEYKEKSISWVQNKHRVENVGEILYKNYEKLLNE